MKRHKPGPRRELGGEGDTAGRGATGTGMRPAGRGGKGRAGHSDGSWVPDPGPGKSKLSAHSEAWRACGSCAAGTHLGYTCPQSTCHQPSRNFGSPLVRTHTIPWLWN